MHSESRFLSSAALQLKEALDDLDSAVVTRNGLERQLSASHRKIGAVLKTLARTSTSGDLAQLRKLQAAHEKLHRKMEKAQSACTIARTRFEDREEELNRRSMARAGRIAGLERDLDDLRRCHEGMNNALLSACDRILGLDPMDQAALGYESRSGEYDYIPVHVPFFLQLLTDLNHLLHEDPAYADGPHGYRPVSFLEVGCGTGRNLWLARAARLVDFETCQGFDINPDLITLGQDKFGLGEAIFVDDAMRHAYGAYDVVFTYRPFSDTAMQTAYEDRLARGLRPGAYLLSPYPLDLARYSQLVAMPGARNIWRKRDAG